MVENLGLDQALVTVNKSTHAALRVYYQIDECFGCPLDEYETLFGKLENFVIGTKYKLQLELRLGSRDKDNTTICKFNDLELNNHGHYRIDVTLPTNGSNNSDCSMQTLEKGACSMCPLAILLCVLFVVTAGEKLYSKFVSNKKRVGGRRRNSKSPESSAQLEQDEQQSNDRNQQVIEEGAAAVAENAATEQLNEAIATGEGIIGKTSSSQANRNRIESLDAFRGLTIAGMILVNYGGAGYSILQHKPWDGITLADFVFPFFIFSMGASTAISTRSMVKKGKTFHEILVKILRRSILLMAIGLCLNSRWLNGRGLSDLRLTGVLQRFSISYLVVAIMYTIELTINKWIKAQSLYRIPFLSSLMGNFFEVLTAINYLVIYIYITFYFEYNSTCPIGYIGPGGQTEGGRYANCTGGAAAWLDKLVLGENHLYNDREVKHIFKTEVSHDPEGILGYTTSILLTLIGLQCGKIMVRSKNHKTRLLMFSQWMAMLIAASVSVVIIPVNKRLWSLTFVTLTGACAYLITTLLYLIMDVYNCQRTFFLRLIVSAGKNSIFLYVGHSTLNGMLPWYFSVDESSHLQLLLRLSWSTFVWLLIAHYMASKRLFIRL